MERLIPHFANDAGQSVVGFEAAATATRIAGERFLTINNERAYLIGDTVCGTCHFLFKKLRGANRTFEAEAAAASNALRDLCDFPSQDLLLSLGRLLPPRDYAVALLTVRPHLVMPSSDLDYFAHECISLFGVDPYYGVPHSPKTPYYRLCTLTMPPDGLVVELGIPLHQPGVLERDTVEHYKAALQDGRAATAFAVGVLDIRQPADWEGEPEITKHYVLAHYFLDGHHKMQAAAELGEEIQLLSYVSREEGVYGNGDLSELDRVLRLLLHGPCE